MAKKTHILCILDGYGYREDTSNNAVTRDNAPYFFSLFDNNPHSFLKTGGEDVGLPEGQMGNSEVGHMNLGAGRVVYQDLPKINKSIKDNELASQKALVEFMAELKKSKGTCHLMGLASAGGIHSHEAHIVALAKAVADAGVPVRVHAITDGRDTAPQSAIQTVPELETKLNAAGSDVKLASLCGRYWAMDRDNRWERVVKAYDLMTKGEGNKFASVKEALEASYKAEKNDEFVEPVVLPGFKAMEDGDGVLMANFRADRAREILACLVKPDFRDFERKKKVSFAAKLGMVQYSSDLNEFVDAIFPPKDIQNSLGEVISKKGLKQLRLAETEKYAHVTYFFNGGIEEVFSNEDRILVPSPKVATYDLQPEMSAAEVTTNLVKAINSKEYDLIVINYANGDMVGHTGVLEAAKTAVRALDKHLKEVVSAVEATDAVMIITADHGNCEQMYDDEKKTVHTAHTLNVVPCVLVNEKTGKKIKDGKLADLAPTILTLMGMEIPAEMDGEVLV